MKIGIVHYRTGRTDGVSLEIEKRRKVLETLGHEVRIISGPISNGADYVITELEFDLPHIIAIKENAFAYFRNTDMTVTELMLRIGEVSLRIKDEFTRICEQEKFDMLLLHNIFSHGRHVAAASAFAHFIRSNKIDVIATHHDFYWERREYAQPSFPEVESYLREYVPMRSPRVRHVCINSLAINELRERRNIESELVPDVFDFSQPRWKRDKFNADLLHNINVSEDDLIVLQATRTVQRKGIELAIRLVDRLNHNRHRLTGTKLYNGKELSWDSQIVLVLAGYAEKASLDYVAKLKKLAQSLGVEIRFIGGVISAARQSEPKRYSLWDAYACADLITYPSLSEGWGNQFIEAVFARRPLAVFEYPVFLSDIINEGYEYISLGRKTGAEDELKLCTLSEHALRSACDAAIDWLTSKNTAARLKRNFLIGKRNHDLSVLHDFFKEKLPQYSPKAFEETLTSLIPSKF
jgi:glycosyltransferase involved in cell wall biosynthesis